jgi:acrylyl-CoA reductase (NADPH)
MFKALLLEQADGKLTPALRELEERALPAGNVMVAVEYSSINYKDGLIVTGSGGLIKRYPHVPGIDFAGTVLESGHPAWRSGDQVVLTGWRVGEVRWGGCAQKARVEGDWLVPLPAGLSSRQAMMVGTAGFTAMLAIIALEAHGLDAGAGTGTGEVLVTGAAGGVGSIATAILAKRGYQVVASTGRAAAHDYLRQLGATTIIDRTPFAEPATRPLESERWAACVDAVGGNTLARVLAQLKYGGAAAAVGLAGGARLEHSVIPFLLRGVSLLGIDSVMCPRERRLAAWRRIQTDLPLDRLEALSTEVGLAEVPRVAGDILQGRVRGRVVVNVNG